MKKDDKDYETQKQLRLEKLGTNNPICVACGENNWECIEDHHIGGKVYDDLTSLACCNCHRKLTVRQNCHPKQIAKSPSFEESLAHLLRGLADLFVRIAETFIKYSELLLQKMQSGDTK